MSESLQTYQGLTDCALTVQDIKAQVNLIGSIMRSVMQDGEHYGTIPGCGNKPALLKPGAEKIMATFRLSNDTDIETVEMPRDHREYRVKVTLYSPAGNRLGTGVGSCSTMEGKYRYRVGGGELTDIVIPKSYWDTNRGSPVEAAKILKGLANKAGIEGDKFGKKKNDFGQWVITTFGDKVEHDNPADYYNTCLKMAKKRALVDAVLTTTAASDIFTQDGDDDLDPDDIPPNPDPDDSANNGKSKRAETKYMSADLRTKIEVLLASKIVPESWYKKAMITLNGNPTEPEAEKMLAALSGLQDKTPAADGALF
ncbi:MAG: hypothetical protein HGA87_01305 [Desulfobulbaceae bacterium]|nr:hypothetical protein [Desulfobulbaceae bacterium]